MILMLAVFKASRQTPLFCPLSLWQSLTLISTNQWRLPLKVTHVRFSEHCSVFAMNMLILLQPPCTPHPLPNLAPFMIRSILQPSRERRQRISLRTVKYPEISLPRVTGLALFRWESETMTGTLEKDIKV